MATTDRVDIDPSEGRINITNLEIHDEEAVDFLSEMDEDNRTELIERALKIGLTAVRLMDTSQEV
ncbi:MAG: hypothetical protein ABEI86_00500, partial [Halobacteriaceae archaeon]